ncbi:hypothetical protein NDU88_009854 [Pleurodeles waltl]|uniref:Uncharacterized protein n=1 Tax=Pleurodeles waltl TaxID=8319 RepID=A0AAV7Q067_PLEWA|nr:hypothetical protein NDU88_009854 [Pleurodeles waltl]
MDANGVGRLAEAFNRPLPNTPLEAETTISLPQDSIHPGPEEAEVVVIEERVLNAIHVLPAQIIGINLLLWRLKDSRMFAKL